MNQLLTNEAAWRNAFLRQIETWDRVADSINPLLFVALLGAALCLSRTSHAHAWRFLGRSALAVLFSFVAVKLLQRLDWFEAGRDISKIRGGFPSTHMAVAVSLATSLFFAARKWLMLIPLLLFYAWLMTALRYHLWIDIWGSALIATTISATLHALLSRSKNVSRQLDMTSSTRTLSRSAKDGAAKGGAARKANGSAKNVKTRRKSRPKVRRF